MDFSTGRLLGAASSGYDGDCCPPVVDPYTLLALLAGIALAAPGHCQETYYGKEEEEGCWAGRSDIPSQYRYLQYSTKMCQATVSKVLPSYLS